MSESTGDFDKDLARLDQIRRAHHSARPKQENPAWMNSEKDIGFLLEFIDRLWAEYSVAMNRGETVESVPPRPKH